MRREVAALPILSPIIPAGTIWLRREKRFMLGQEVMYVQGIYAKSVNMSQNHMKEMAGQAMCAASTIPIPALVSTDAFWP